MCHFITVILPQDAHVEDVCRIASSCGASLLAAEGASLAEHLRPGERYFRATGRYCDCGTVLGSAHRARNTPELQAVRGKRRGWSAVKLERWRKQRDAADQARAARAVVPPEKEPDWIRLVAELDRGGAASSIALLLHFYEHDLRDEEIELRGRQLLPAASLRIEDLAAIKEDVLYEIPFGTGRRPRGPGFFFAFR